MNKLNRFNLNKKTFIYLSAITVSLFTGIAFATTTGTLPAKINTFANWAAGIFVSCCFLLVLYYMAVIKFKKQYDDNVKHIIYCIIAAMVALLIPEILREIGISGAIF